MKESLKSATTLQTEARKLSGSKLLLGSYVALGLPLSLEQNDLLRALLFGNQGLLDDQIISLIYADAIQSITANNLALGKPARQSSNNFGTTGAEAVDGNTDGDSAHGSVSHTHPDNPAWWEVDLQTLSRVNEVRIYNRTDCCAERLSNFDVMLSTDGQNWQKVLVPGPAGSPTTVPFDGVPARYVRIQLRDANFLSLAEVEVTGKVDIQLIADERKNALDLLLKNILVKIHSGEFKEYNPLVDTALLKLDLYHAAAPYLEPDYWLKVRKAGMGNGTVASSPSGVNCGNTCSASYPSGTVATLTATPATDGSAFAGWTGACSGTGTCTVTLNQDWAVTATFSFGVPLPNYALVVSKTGTGSGTVTSSPSGIDCGNTCSASYPSGTVVTLTATPATDGSTFAGWTGACSGTGTCKATVNQSLQVTATFTNQTDTGNNLALGKPARQSSNNFGTTGAEAVDGNTDGDSAHGSVSHTHPDNPAWWEVDLQTLSRVNEVRIYNRTDCCAERLSNFDVMLSTDGQNWQKVLVPGPAGSPTTVPFDGVPARYVRIQLRDANFLLLAEVEVRGTVIGNNLALGKPARQSSNNFGTTGAEAVDGNTDGDSAHGSVSHTHPDNPAWWEVDLQTLSRVNEVRIYNRTDCCAERLSNFDVMLSTDGQNWQKVLVPGPAGSPTTVPFDGVPARYVRIQLRDANFLLLAEVEVRGTVIGNNLALGKPARQSSNNFGTTGAEAVDGNTDGDSAHGSVSHTHPDNPAWWEVDLQTLSRVNEVRIYNRTDCCAERLSNFDVMLSTDGQNWQKVLVPGPAGSPTTVPFDGVPARYVRIQLRDANFLLLAEVEVRGTALVH